MPSVVRIHLRPQNNAEVAQLIEHQPSKLRVASLSLVFRSKKKSTIFGGLFCVVSVKVNIVKMWVCRLAPPEFYPFFAGSQVRPTPNFLKILRSTSLSITVECTWQPLSFGSCSNAWRQFSSMLLKIERATSTSSV